VIDVGHALESPEAVTLFSVRDHVSEPPPNSTWKASSTRPEAKPVGWPRFAGGGENVFAAGGGSTVVGFGLS
jgi:hypothetical protein